jgi:hypothetical protein
MFLFDLCLELGYASPRRLLAEITSEELTYWKEYFQIRPWGYVRYARMLGTLAAQQYNLNRTKNKKPLSWDSFFPVEIVEKDDDGRDTNENIIKFFQQYNLDRGYSADGKTKLTPKG